MAPSAAERRTRPKAGIAPPSRRSAKRNGTDGFADEQVDIDVRLHSGQIASPDAGLDSVIGPIADEGVAVGGAFDSDTVTGLMPVAHRVAGVLTGIALGIGGLAGAYTGARIQSRLPGLLIRRVMGILVLAIGIRYLSRSAPADPRSRSRPGAPSPGRPCHRRPAGGVLARRLADGKSASSPGPPSN